MSCSQATRSTNERSASVSMNMRLICSWTFCCANSGWPPCFSVLAHSAARSRRHRRRCRAPLAAELEIAEQIAAGGVAAAAAGLAHAAVDVADHVGVRHARVLEDHFAVLIEAPAALVEHLADAEAGRVARHQEQGGALLGRHGRIGARVDEEQLADRRVGDEGLLAVEDPFVALALGAQLEPGLRIVGRRHAVVGAGARLGDALAEHERCRRRRRPAGSAASAPRCRTPRSDGSTSSSG